MPLSDAVLKGNKIKPQHLGFHQKAGDGDFPFLLRQFSPASFDKFVYGKCPKNSNTLFRTLFGLKFAFYAVVS